MERGIFRLHTISFWSRPLQWVEHESTRKLSVPYWDGYSSYYFTVLHEIDASTKKIGSFFFMIIKIFHKVKKWEVEIWQKSEHVRKHPPCLKPQWSDCTARRFGPKNRSFWPSQPERLSVLGGTFTNKTFFRDILQILPTLVILIFWLNIKIISVGSICQMPLEEVLLVNVPPKTLNISGWLGKKLLFFGPNRRAEIATHCTERVIEL